MQLYRGHKAGLSPPRTLWFQPEDQGCSGPVMMWTGATNWTGNVRGQGFRVRCSSLLSLGFPKFSP